MYDRLIQEENRKMESKKRLRLAIVLIVSAMILSYTIATIDYLRHKQTLIKHNEFQLSQIEENVIDALTTVEKAYSLFDDQTVVKMEENTEEFMHLYE